MIRVAPAITLLLPRKVVWIEIAKPKIVVLKAKNNGLDLFTGICLDCWLNCKHLQKAMVLHYLANHELNMGNR